MTTRTPRDPAEAWMEALLGARLHFHASHETSAQAQRTYKRWSQLYHSDPAVVQRLELLYAD